MSNNDLFSRYSALYGAENAKRILGGTTTKATAPSVPEVAEASEPSAEDDEAVVEAPVEPGSATHEGAGWYRLSDTDEKIRGKQAVLDAGYTITDED